MRKKYVKRTMRVTHCEFCGKEIRTPRTEQKFCNRTCYSRCMRERPEKRRDYFPKINKSTLCWTCKRTNQFECSWFTKDMIPVPGWKAIERPTMDGISYIVLECPNYEREGR